MNAQAFPFHTQTVCRWTAGVSLTSRVQPVCEIDDRRETS